MEVNDDDDGYQKRRRRGMVGNNLAKREDAPLRPRYVRSTSEQGPSAAADRRHIRQRREQRHEGAKTGRHYRRPGDRQKKTGSTESSCAQGLAGVVVNDKRTPCCI